MFEKFKKAAVHLSKTEKDDEYYSDGVWPSDFNTLGLDESLYQNTLDIADQLLSCQEKLLEQFDNFLESKIGYYNIPRFNYSIEHGNSSIHDEGKSKTMALVIYLIPETTNGTKLYNGPNPENLVSELEWKPNRAMLMISQPGITWHSYKSNGGPRFTLNFYFEKMESLSNLDNFNLDRKLWFYDQMSKDRLYTLTSNDKHR
jgi:hypothetical protein